MNLRNSLLIFALSGISLAAVGCNKETTANASGQSLTIILKTDQHIERGEVDEVLVTVNRDDFDGPVAIEFTNLPSGVTLLDAGPIPKGDNTRTYRLSAIAGSPLVEDHPVRVTARANGLSVTESFDLTVAAN